MFELGVTSVSITVPKYNGWVMWTESSLVSYHTMGEMDWKRVSTTILVPCLMSFGIVAAGRQPELGDQAKRNHNWRQLRFGCRIFTYQAGYSELIRSNVYFRMPPPTTYNPTPTQSSPKSHTPTSVQPYITPLHTKLTTPENMITQHCKFRLERTPART